jgi:hypothetical protein
LKLEFNSEPRKKCGEKNGEKKGKNGSETVRDLMIKIEWA